MRLAPPAVAVACAAAALLLTATTASAEGDNDGGLWYYNAPGFESLHEQSQGEGITIGVIDTQIDPTTPDLAGANLQVHEPSFCAVSAKDREKLAPATATGDAAVHGTRMTSILVGNGKGIDGHPGTKGLAPKAKVIHYAVGSDHAGESNKVDCVEGLFDGGMVGGAIDQAIADGVDILNISGTYPAFYVRSLARALHAGIIVVAATDDSGGVTLGEPADLNGVVAVDSLTPAGTTPKENNISEKLTVVAPGEEFNLVDSHLSGYTLVSGSSNATAYTSAVLALVWSKYPQANANQILWDLVHNTDGDDHPLQHNNVTGYGVVNARRMLEHDPTTYPADVNPLIADDKLPSAAEIANPAAIGLAWDPNATATPTATPAASPTPADPAATPTPAAAAPSSSSSGIGTPVVVLGVLAALALVGGGVAAAVVARSRRRAGPSSSTTAHPNLAEGTTDV